ncbi:MAG: isocitrate lyase/PEP mutase family protein [Sphaerochaetaceae bacterium]
MTKREKFRALLEEKPYIILPGAYDCMSAKIIEDLGFDTMDVTGLGIEASRLGNPDLGLASMSEVIDQAWSIANSTSLPVIFDADTGYGGVVNVARTVKAFETVGITGIHMEDQKMPKKCGSLSGKELVDIKEMVAKIKVAREVLDDKNFMVIARCDGLRFGVDEVKRRLHAYLDAGADMVMLGDDYPLDLLPTAVEDFRGKMYFVSSVFPTDFMCQPAEIYAQMGIKCISYPVVGFLAAAKAIQDVYKPLKEKNQITQEEHATACMPLKMVNEMLAIDKWFGYEKYMN